MLQLDKYYRLGSPQMLKYLESVPYDIFRDSLYTVDDLYDVLDPDNPESLQQCYDQKVYKFYSDKGDLCMDPMELWARTSHDAAIYDVLKKTLREYHPRKIVGIMGGHSLLRTDSYFRDILQAAKTITELGWLVISGGGPGAMEASHLGAWLSGRSEQEVQEVLSILERAPSFTDPGWYSTAYEVRKRFPQQNRFESIAIPTWLYGHEPPTLFATHYAKLFSNCIREDTLIAVSNGGLVFMPGSAGTLEEVFLATERNHYLSEEYPSPMIFVGKKHWTEISPVYPIVKDMLKNRRFKNLLTALVDDVDSIVDLICDFHNLFPLIHAKQTGVVTSGEDIRNLFFSLEQQPNGKQC